MWADINTEAPKHVFMFQQHELETLQHLRNLKISVPDMQDARKRTQTHTAEQGSCGGAEDTAGLAA